MTRGQLVQSNRGIFSKINDWAQKRELGGRDRNGILARAAGIAPAAAIGASIGSGVAATVAVPVVVGAAAVAAVGYAAYKLHLDKAIVSAALKMGEKAKAVFTKKAGSIKNKAANGLDNQVEQSHVSTLKQAESNPMFDRMNKIVEAHNRGDKFDSQTGQPLGSNPIESMKSQGFNDNQISEWTNREKSVSHDSHKGIAAFASKAPNGDLKSAVNQMNSNRASGPKL